MFILFFFFKQKTAYEMRISDWSSDVCSSDLNDLLQNQSAKRVLIVGADRAGEVLSRDLHRDNRYSVVGFVDDKPGLRGASINEIGRASCRERVCQYV